MKIVLKVQKDMFFNFFCVSLFFIALNFWHLEVYLMLALFMIAIFLNTQRERKVKFDSEFCVLFLANLTYVFLYSIYIPLGMHTILLYAFGPIGSYFIGKVFIYEKEKRLQTTILIIAIGMAFHAILNLVSSEIGIGINERYVKDVWNNSNISATLQGALLAFIIGIVYWLLINKKFFFKLVGIVMVIFILWNSFLTGARTPLFLLVLEVVMLSLYKAYACKNKNLMKKIIKTILGLIILCIIVVVAYNLNLFGLKDMYYNSSLYIRFQTMDSIVQDTRNQHVIDALKNLVKYPMGNIDKQLGRISYAHNFWLDIGRQTGIIPLLLFLIYTIKNFKKYILIIKQKYIGLDTKLLLTGTYSAVGIFLCLEPIMEGSPWVFFMMCMVCGGVASIYKSER